MSKVDDYKVLDEKLRTADYKAKWDTIEKMNAMYDSMTQEEKDIIVPKPSIRPKRGKYLNYGYNVKTKDTLQPFKRDGTVNKEFLQAYGTKSLEKEHNTTREVIMKEVERYG